MEEFLIAAGVGTALGFLAGLGTGGGSLLILWLTLALGTDAQTARSINLLFFLPCALIASFFRRKQGNLPYGKIWPAIAAGCAGAAAASLLGKQLDITAIQKLFGGLLLATGLRELFWKPKET